MEVKGENLLRRLQTANRIGAGEFFDRMLRICRMGKGLDGVRGGVPAGAAALERGRRGGMRGPLKLFSDFSCLRYTCSEYFTHVA
jgi:hypothetical protein